MSPDTFEGRKKVWIWTENKQVMTAAVERGWNSFLFSCPELADDWSCELIKTHNFFSNCFRLFFYEKSLDASGFILVL